MTTNDSSADIGLFFLVFFCGLFSFAYITNFLDWQDYYPAQSACVEYCDAKGTAFERAGAYAVDKYFGVVGKPYCVCNADGERFVAMDFFSWFEEWKAIK